MRGGLAPPVRSGVVDLQPGEARHDTRPAGGGRSGDRFAGRGRGRNAVCGRRGGLGFRRRKGAGNIIVVRDHHELAALALVEAHAQLASAGACVRARARAPRRRDQLRARDGAGEAQPRRAARDHRAGGDLAADVARRARLELDRSRGLAGALAWSPTEGPRRRRQRRGRWRRSGVRGRPVSGRAIVDRRREALEGRAERGANLVVTADCDLAIAIAIRGNAEGATLLGCTACRR